MKSAAFGCRSFPHGSAPHRRISDGNPARSANLVLRMISFSNINKQYGKQLIFVDASFQLNPGEKVGLVGPNGAGKTTLFRMVVGEEAPDEGEVSVPRKLDHRLLPPGRGGDEGPFRAG